MRRATACSARTCSVASSSTSISCTRRAHQPAMILGTDVLAGHRIVIDARHHRVYVTR
jgi:hypothetical protein